MPPSDENLAFDPDALRERYRVERDKRLRGDGNEQYQEMAGSSGTSSRIRTSMGISNASR